MDRLRHSLAWVIAAALFMTGTGGPASAEDGEKDMQGFAWKKRPLMVIAPSPDDPLVADQAGRLDAHAAALAERDIVLITVLGRNVRIDGKPVRRPDAVDLRARYGVAPHDRAVLLLGKDGGVKLRHAMAVAPEELFALIDAMPMRRREMRAYGVD